MFKKISLISLLCVSATYASDRGEIHASDVQANLAERLSANLDTLEEMISLDMPVRHCLTSVGNILLHAEGFCVKQIADIHEKEQYDAYVFHQLQLCSADLREAIQIVLFGKYSMNICNCWIA